MVTLRGIVLFIVTNWVEAAVLKFTNGNIAVGAGYSNDSQQIVPQKCYNATVSSISDQQGYVHLNTALSYSDLENALGISVSIGGQIGVFSAEAKARYLRSVRDQDYSISLNYYQYATNNVALQLAGNDEEALTESGRGFYKGGQNPYFGLICGDYFIESYQQGALLTMGLNIKFSSSSAKEEFEEKAGISFGDIVSAAESVKTVVTEYKITGSITIQAYQMGGEPSQLAKILTNDSSGQYYAMACSLTAIDKCIKAASGLLDYARNQFSSQFSTENNTGLTPLGIAYSQYMPIKYIDLNASVSLVTPEVVQYRNELFSQLTKNEYYQQKFYPFFNTAYPVDLDDAFISNASLVLSKANRNVAILMQEHGGAVDCFNFPDMCKSIKAGIESQFQNITTDDLQFLYAIKYTMTTRGGMFYSTGGNSGDTASWRAVPDDKPGNESLNKVVSVFVTEQSYSYYTVVKASDSSVLYDYSYNGKLVALSSNGTKLYVGTMLSKRDDKSNWTTLSTTYSERTLLSPFFFDVYNMTKQNQP